MLCSRRVGTLCSRGTPQGAVPPDCLRLRGWGHQSGRRVGHQPHDCTRRCLSSTVVPATVHCRATSTGICRGWRFCKTRGRRRRRFTHLWGRTRQRWWPHRSRCASPLCWRWRWRRLHIQRFHLRQLLERVASHGGCRGRSARRCVGSTLQRPRTSGGRRGQQRSRLWRRPRGFHLRLQVQCGLHMCRSHAVLYQASWRCGLPQSSRRPSHARRRLTARLPR